MNEITILPEVALSDVNDRVRELQNRISEGSKTISKAEEMIAAAELSVALHTHELSYWCSLGRTLLTETLDKCRSLILDSMKSNVPVDRALEQIHGLSRAIFFLQMNAISNQYGLVEEAKEIVSELKTRVPTWFSLPRATSDNANSTEPRP